ncbi:MAG: late competence development ComFB family protein [Anaerotruncus sp.]|jgi:competence protein ComFB|nr:late competence development ComFB family protein [Anaerotruncus sp.]
METILKNAMELIVQQKLEDMLPKMDCCKCDICRMDVMAIALNRLPPKYVVSTQGEVYSRAAAMSVQRSTDITAAIVEAIQLVKEKPRHD